MWIFGASGHGKVIAEIAELNNVNIDGFIDENNSKETIFGYNVVKKIPYDTSNIIIAIGDNIMRKNIVKKISKSTFPILFHPKATISKTSSLGEGTVVMSGVSINSSTLVGKHCIVNTNASVDHDCVLKDFVHISPNAALAGNVKIGEGTHVGMGACVIQNVKIGKWCTIGAGAVILKDVPDGSTVVGNPGVIIKSIT